MSACTGGDGSFIKVDDQNTDFSNFPSLKAEKPAVKEFKRKLYEAMDMSPQKVSLDDLLKRLTKEHKFSLKVIKLVKDTEDMDKSAQPSLADCWRWLKGLLYDFVKLQKEMVHNKGVLKNADALIDQYTSDLRNKKMGFVCNTCKKFENQ